MTTGLQQSSPIAPKAARLRWGERSLERFEQACNITLEQWLLIQPRYHSFAARHCCSPFLELPPRLPPTLGALAFAVRRRRRLLCKRTLYSCKAVTDNTNTRPPRVEAITGHSSSPQRMCPAQLVDRPSASTFEETDARHPAPRGDWTVDK